jgi:cell division transport system permease protein
MSLKLDLQRITKEGFMNFWRTKLVSFSTLIVMTMALLVASSLIFLNAIINFSITQLQDRVDINVYFFPDTPEVDVIAFQNRIIEMPLVRDINYVSREEALLDFQQRHSEDELISRSLEELGDNPLGASLNIRTFDSSQYEALVLDIEQDPVVLNTSFVDKINYNDNKLIIDRLNDFSGTIRLIGYGIIIVFSIVTLLVILSTLRIAIFAARNEIIVKRLVGAEYRYVRGPFVVMGALYGLFGSLFTILALFPLTRWVGSYTETFFGGINIFDYYSTNVFSIFIVLLVLGIFLGTIASRLAVQKYINK